MRTEERTKSWNNFPSRLRLLLLLFLWTCSVAMRACIQHSHVLQRQQTEWEKWTKNEQRVREERKKEKNYLRQCCVVREPNWQPCAKRNIADHICRCRRGRGRRWNEIRCARCDDAFLWKKYFHSKSYHTHRTIRTTTTTKENRKRIHIIQKIFRKHTQHTCTQHACTPRRDEPRWGAERGTNAHQRIKDTNAKRNKTHLRIKNTSAAAAAAATAAAVVCQRHSVTKGFLGV